MENVETIPPESGELIQEYFQSSRGNVMRSNLQEQQKGNGGDQAHHFSGR